MASIARPTLETPLDWDHIASRAAEWASGQGLDLRSAVLLVPFAQHLAPARRAWAKVGGWLPRIETTRTLAALLGPAPRSGEGQLTLEASVDRLAAAAMLRTQTWLRREIGFDAAVSAFVSTAHALWRAAASLTPAARDAHWEAGRALLVPAAGPDATERALARLALEWAAIGPAASTDLLFTFKPSAWMAVQAGGPDALTVQLMEAADDSTPCVVFDADAAIADSLNANLTLAECESFEDEAQCAASQVLSHLNAGLQPVALVAQDRVLVRRIRALLERQGVPLRDETGWKLSTTRAAAQVMSLLRAAEHNATADAWMDWLKSGAWPQMPHAAAQLEVACRRHGWSRPAAIDPARLTPAAAQLHTQASLALNAFAATRRQPLRAWLAALTQALQQAQMWQALVADDAGSQVAQALWLGEHEVRANRQAALTAMTYGDFSAWVDAALEDAAFIPLDPLEAAAVVITPLASVMLRPFAAVVFPGADSAHLGAGMRPQPLLNETQSESLGVATMAQRRTSEALAFQHAVCRGPVNFFHRRSDGNEPLAASPLLERLALRLGRSQLELEEWRDPRVAVQIEPTPQTMPAPAAGDLLPVSLSASACEALRECPYRFYALHMLKLREADELADDIEKRDYGTWLHEVLNEFHTLRVLPPSPETDFAGLMAAAQAAKLMHRLDDADFLPYDAAFNQLVPLYLAWLHARDAQGAAWAQGEVDQERQPAEWKGIAMHGRIDRIDSIRGDAGQAAELIDYKTSSADKLKKKVDTPFEDTQLAFYAALVYEQICEPLKAGYLALGRKVEYFEHPSVGDSAGALLHHLGDELHRIREGAGLPALGEEPVCEHCEARGLCRRDQWASS